MYAISLWQPWASLIAVGAKPFETRDWFPPAWLIGQRIAVHAAIKPMPRDVEDEEDFTVALGGRGWRSTLPMGAVVCTAILAGAYQCGRSDRESANVVRTMAGSLPLVRIKIDPFGDYAIARIAWRLKDIEPLTLPIPAKGKQGFWKWDHL